MKGKISDDVMAPINDFQMEILFPHELQIDRRSWQQCNMLEDADQQAELEHQHYNFHQ